MRPLTFTAASGRGQVAPKQTLARRDFLSLCGPRGNSGLQTQPHPGLANLQRTLSLLQSHLLSSHHKCVDWLICSLVAKSSGSFTGFPSFDSVLLVPLWVCFSASHLLKGSAGSMWGCNGDWKGTNGGGIEVRVSTRAGMKRIT